MYPVFIDILGRPIYWYGVCVALGFLGGVVTWNFLGRRDGKPPGFGSEMAFWIMVAGLIGARMTYVIAHVDHYAAHPMEVIRFDKGGLVYYGGLLGGFAGLAMFARLHRIPLPAVGDYAVTGLALGHALGRIGCFLNGCCFGALCTVGPRVSYPPGSPASVEHTRAGWLPHDMLPSLHVHPTQVYEALLNLVLYALLVRFYLKRPKPGRVAALYLMLYPPGRFLLEFLRGDARQLWLHFTAAQELSLVLFIAGCALWVLPGRRETGHGNA